MKASRYVETADQETSLEHEETEPELGSRSPIKDYSTQHLPRVQAKVFDSMYRADWYAILVQLTTWAHRHPDSRDRR